MSSAVKQAYEYLVSLATIALVVAGIVGVSFYAFRDRGWIEVILGRVWTLEMDYPLIAIPLTIAAALAFRAWRNHNLALGRVSRVPAFLLYCLMAAGAYFIAQYALHAAA